MKTMIKRCLSWAAQNSIVWSVLSKTIVPLGYYLTLQHEAPLRKETKQRRQQKLADILTAISPDQKVKNGPFSGMIYPDLESVGSTLAPKIIGSL